MIGMEYWRFSTIPKFQHSIRMKFWIQKRISAAFLTLLALFFLPSLALAGQHRVIRIVDGDTIIVWPFHPFIRPGCF
jgi:hypothetical protein